MSEIITLVQNTYGYTPTEATITSAVRNLNFEFVTENSNKKLTPVNEIYNLKIVK